MSRPASTTRNAPLPASVRSVLPAASSSGDPGTRGNCLERREALVAGP